MVANMIKQKELIIREGGSSYSSIEKKGVEKSQPNTDKKNWVDMERQEKDVEDIRLRIVCETEDKTKQLDPKIVYWD